MGKHCREAVTVNPPNTRRENRRGNLIWTRHPPAHHLQFINSRRQGPEKQPETSENSLGELHGGNRWEAVTVNPPNTRRENPSEISYGRAILQPAIYKFINSRPARALKNSPQPPGISPGDSMGNTAGSCRRKPPETRREGRRKSHMDTPSSSPPSTIYQRSPGKTLKNSPQPPGISPGDSMGNTAGKLSEKATRNPPGRTPGTTGKTPENLRNCRRENPFSRHAPPLRWQGLRHISICQRTSLSISIHPHPITHAKAPPSPCSWGLGASTQRPTALAGGTAAPMLVGWVFVCMEPKRPVPQNAAGGRPLLVGLPPSTPTTAPFGTKRSTQLYVYLLGLGA